MGRSCDVMGWMDIYERERRGRGGGIEGSVLILRTCVDSDVCE